MNIEKPTQAFFQLPGMKRNRPDDEPSRPDSRGKRLPGLGWVPNRTRNHLIAFLGEFIGTFMFLFFAFAATQVANAAAAAATRGNSGAGGEDSSLASAPNAGTLLYIALAFGFSLAVNAWIFFRITGGLFNPAVTLGMALIGAVGWFRALICFVAQILGSIAASAVVLGLFPGPLNVATTLSGGTSIAQGLFIEMFLTAELIFTIFMLAAEKHKGTFLAPIGIGLALFIAELAGVFYTGGSLNPARSFGPAVVLGSFPGHHWIYWLGPALGALVAVGFYRLVKLLEYETANPGQDFDDREAENFQFDEDNARGADVVRPVASVQSEYRANSLDTRPTSGGYPNTVGQVPGSGGRVDGGYPNTNTVGQVPVSGGRIDGGRVDGAANSTLDPKMHPGYPNNMPAPTSNTQAYRNGPHAEAGDLGASHRR